METPASLNVIRLEQTVQGRNRFLPRGEHLAEGGLRFIEFSLLGFARGSVFVERGFQFGVGSFRINRLLQGFGIGVGLSTKTAATTTLSAVTTWPLVVMR